MIVGKTDTHRKQSQAVLAIRSNVPGDRIVISDSLGIATSNTPHMVLLNKDMTVILYKAIRYDDKKKGNLLTANGQVTTCQPFQYWWKLSSDLLHHSHGRLSPCSTCRVKENLPLDL